MNESILIGVVIGLILIMVTSIFNRKASVPLGSTRTVRNAGYMDLSGGRLTHRVNVPHDHLEIKDLDTRHPIRTWDK